ncbi:MAG: hypothetical protein J7L78_03055 [Dehalococcoidales bacterium]|nr:hypothetical protein [Dehalococcoidales bacterium]
MKLKKLIGILVAVAVCLLLATPVLAASLGISPSYTELEVPGNGSATANFQVHYFSGDLQVSLVDIPLRVEPTTIHIDQSDEPTNIQLTFYGNETLGSQTYDGYVRFLGMTGGTVAVAVRVKATVNHIVAGQPLPAQTGDGENFTMPLWGWIVIGIVVLAVVVFAVSRRFHIEIRKK